MTEVFDNPLVTRYASAEMARLWGPQRKFSTWRRLWVALAEAEMELGLLKDDGATPRIKPQQVVELRAHIDDIDFERAAAHERRGRHDVMSHIHTYAEACPSAGDIIHLGETSCYVTDNTDLILMREGLGFIRDRLVGVIDALARFSERWKALPTLAFTHFQPAQLTTVGKRASLWCHDFVLDLYELEHRIGTIKLRGVKGTTGTQSSFLALFRGDHQKVVELEQLVALKMGFAAVYPVTAQTYSRKIDSQILDALSGIAQSAHKFGTDLRLLAHRQEVEEPFEAEQVGSSAMAYKRNPMRAERMCGLSRFVMNLTSNAAQTAAVQWLERTLDDSVNRRLSLPQAFLGTDAILRIALNIAGGLVVNREVIERNVAQALPYMATENILMAAVTHGGNRQELHERIRQHSLAATGKMKQGGANELLQRLQADSAFTWVNWQEVAAPERIIGRAPQQVEDLLEKEISPIRHRYPTQLGQTADLQV